MKPKKLSGFLRMQLTEDTVLIDVQNFSSGEKGKLKWAQM
jgi:hypothetical protein